MKYFLTFFCFFSLSLQAANTEPTTLANLSQKFTGFQNVLRPKLSAAIAGKDPALYGGDEGVASLLISHGLDANSVHKIFFDELGSLQDPSKLGEYNKAAADSLAAITAFSTMIKGMVGQKEPGEYVKEAGLAFTFLAAQFKGVGVRITAAKAAAEVKRVADAQREAEEAQRKIEKDAAYAKMTLFERAAYNAANAAKALGLKK